MFNGDVVLPDLIVLLGLHFDTVAGIDTTIIVGRARRKLQYDRLLTHC